MVTMERVLYVLVVGLRCAALSKVILIALSELMVLFFDQHVLMCIIDIVFFLYTAFRPTFSSSCNKMVKLLDKFITLYGDYPPPPKKKKKKRLIWQTHIIYHT